MRRQKVLARLHEELNTLALFDRLRDYATNTDAGADRAYDFRQIRRSQVMAEIKQLDASETRDYEERK